MTSAFIAIYRENYATFKIECTKDGVAFDLTGSILHFYVKNYAYDLDSKALIHKYTANGIVHQVTVGEAILTIQQTDTTNFELRDYIFDIVLISPDTDNHKWTICRGKFIVRKGE